MKSVPFIMSMWNVVCDISISNFFKKLSKQHSSRNTVRIVVAVNQYFFLFLNSKQDSLHRLAHIFHKIWIMEMTNVIQAKKMLRFYCRINAPVKEKFLYKWVACG